MKNSLRINRAPMAKKNFTYSSWHDVTRTLSMTVGSPSAHRRSTMLKLVSVLVLILTVGVGNAWGAKHSMTPNQATTGSSSTVYITSLTPFSSESPAGSKIKWQMNQWNPKNLQVKCNQTNAANEFRFYTDSVLPGKITKVVVTFSALTVSDASKLMFKGGTSAQTGTSDGTAGTWNGTAKTLTWTPGSSDNYTYFAFYQNGKAASGTNYLASSDAIVVTYLTKVTLDKNTGSADGVAYFDDNATGASTATGYTFSAATHASKTCTGYYTAPSDGTKVLNADGSFAASNVSGYITSSKWTYAGGTLKLYAQWESAGTSVSLSKAATTNGSFVLSSSNTGTPEINSVSTAGGTGTVYVKGTPNTGYYVSSVTQSGASAAPTITEVSENNWTVVYGSGTTGTSTITVTFSPIWALKGSFDSWGDGYLMSGTGTVSVTRTLTANTRYEFKIYNKGIAYGNTGAIVHSVSGWTFATDKDNCILYTGPAGSYTFSINTSTKAASVTYPSVDHPNANYVYIKKGAGWSDARIYNYQSGSDSKMSDWGGSPILASCEICDETYYYGAAYFNKIIFRDGGSNQSNEVSLDRGKWLDETTHADSWSTFYKYDITYDKGTGSGDAMASHEDLCPGSDQTLTECSYTKQYNSFTGWKTNAALKYVAKGNADDGTHEVDVAVNGTVPNEAKIKNVQSDITLTAQWSVIPVTALTLNYSTLKRYVGESDVTLSVSSVTPNTANPAVTWTSSDATVASVDGGVVSFLKAGTATITATSTISGSITATCSVEVRSISSPTMQDEDGTTISGSGLSATWTLGTRTLTASEGTSKYKFKRWIVTNATPASTTNLSTTLGDPTGNVTVVAEFYKPRTVTKGTGTGTSTFTVSPTGDVKYGSSVTVTCAATDGYKNPWTLTVTPSDGATYSSSGSDGSITISNITKNITVDLAYTDKGCTTHGASSITSGASTGYTQGPVDEFYKYSTRQIIYTKSDLGLAAGKKGTIKSISFQYGYGTAMTKKTDVDIYLANTNLTSLTTGSYVPYANFTKVYSGALNCSGNGTWNEFEFTTSFEYNGVGQLVVMIDDNSGDYDGMSYVFKCHSGVSGAQVYKRQDSDGDIDPETWTPANETDSRPNTKFCIEEDDMTPATVNWYVNGSIEHTQTDYPGTALTSIPTPDSEDCDGEKEFVGWYTDDYTHASIAPAFVNPTVIPEGGADYYAVFATTSPTNNYQKITSEGDLVAGAKYLIVGNSSTTYNALPVDAATSLIGVTPSESVISSPAASLIWTLEGSADAWKIKSTSNNKYIQISGGSLSFEESTSLTFSVSVSSYIFTFTSSAASGNKILSYYHGGKPSQFNAYSSANTVYVYKQVINATNFATTCATTYDVNRAGTPAGTVTGGTFTVSPSKQAAGKTVTLSATPDLGYSFDSWTVTKTESPYTDITSTNVAGNTLTMPAYGVTVNASFTPTPTMTATGGDLSSTTLPFGTSCEQDEGTDKTFVLNGYSLTNDVTLTIGGTDASMFSVKSPSSPIDKGTGRITDQTVTITFTPTSTGAKTATLTIASSGASSIVLTLSGTAIKHYKVHYWNSGTDVHQESVLAGEDASATWDGVDDEDGCDTETYKYFVGWSKTNVGSIPTTTKPTIGETYTSLSSDVNYYAVWTNVNPGGWERYESSTLAEGDYLIVQKSGETYYTMKNSQVGSNPYRMDHGVAVFSGSLISAPSSELSYDLNDFIWHIAESSTSGYYTIYNADESKYIAATGVAKDIAFVASPADNKELFSFTYNSTSKTYNWTSKYNTDNSVSAHFRDANSGWACYAAQSNDSYLYYRAGGTAKYITNCCDKNVTLATNSPSHGSITFSPSGTISTCGADAATRQTTMTVTPDEGYYLSTWSTSGVSPASLSADIAYGSVSNSGAQATTVTFTQNTTTGIYTANATFSPIPVSSLTLHAIKKDNTSATIFDETGNNVALSLYPTEGKTASPADPLGHTVKIEFGAVLPANALNKGYTWSATVNGAAVGWSSNDLATNAVLEFNKSSGKVVAKAAGTAEIIITTDDGSGVTAKVTITVANVALSTLNVAKSSTTLYLGEAEDIAVTYDPVNTTTKGYTTGSYTYVTIGRSNNKITLTGKAVTPGEPERVTLTSSDAGAKTATIDVTVKPLPKVTFVDNLQGKTDFSNWGSDGVVSSTVTDGVVTHTKPTPSHTDISDPGASYNACERSHLHLVGWIESEWADAHPSATHEQIVGANVSNGAGTFLEAGADLNVETYNGNIYYAVWSQVE